MSNEQPPGAPAQPPATQADEITVVDEVFWLGWAATVVESSAIRIDEGATRVATAMAWLWGVYTAVVLAAGIVHKLDLDPTPKALLVTPALLLFVAYAVATWAALPNIMAFDPRQPWAVKACYDKSIKRKSQRLAAAVALAALATILVATGVAIQLSKKEPPASGLAIEYADSTHQVIVGGVISPRTAVLVETKGAGHIQQAAGMSSADGSFQQTVDVTANATYQVTVTWESADHYRLTVTKAMTT